MTVSFPEAQTHAYVTLAYVTLRQIAAGYLRREKPGTTLQPTALVHEAFLRLVKSGDLRFTDRTHFLAIAARAMREILVDRARTKNAEKRNPAEALPSRGGAPLDNRRMMAIDDALGRLSELDPQQARIVEMRFFGGMTGEEVAEHLGISLRTVRRDWSTARAWLRLELRRAGL